MPELVMFLLPTQQVMYPDVLMYVDRYTEVWITYYLQDQSTALPSAVVCISINIYIFFDGGLSQNSQT